MTASAPLAVLQSVWKASIEIHDPPTAIGIDLVEVEPLAQLLEAGGRVFADTAWTAREQREANGQPETLAGKWAAKEAVMKALQHGIGDIDPKDVEIITHASGAPSVELHRSARLAAKHRQLSVWAVSVTHEGGWAAAIALGSHPHKERRDIA